MNSLIAGLNQWSADVPGWASQMFWQSTALIAVVCLMDFACRRKLRAAIRCALWLVVLLKLVLPPALALPTSLAWWLRPGAKVERFVPNQNVIVTYEQTAAPVHPLQVLRPVPQPKSRLSAPSMIVGGAALVSLVLLGWLLGRWFQVAHDAREAEAPPQNLRDALDCARNLAGWKRPVRLRVTRKNLSPAVCGLFRPVILLSESLVRNLPPNQLRVVLVHELIHLQRRDVWVNCLQTLLQIVYWWHPLVWFANARIRRLREEAVDDAVMLLLREEADCYAPTLLEVAKLAFQRPLASLGLVGILESRSALRQRIERLLDFQMPRRAGLSLVSIVGIAAFTALAVPMGEAPSRPKLLQSIQQRTGQATVMNDAWSSAQGIEWNLGNISLPSADATNQSFVVALSEAKSSVATTNLTLVSRSFDLDMVKLLTTLRLPTNSLTDKDRQHDFSSRFLDYFKFRSVDLRPPKHLFFDAEGLVWFHTTAGDLEGIEAILQTNSWLKPTAGLLAGELTRVKVSDKPINYSFEESAVVSSPKAGPDSPQLFTRIFKVNTNAFLQALSESAVGPDFSGGPQTAPGSRTNSPDRVFVAVSSFFRKIGVNLDPPKNVFYGDRKGLLMVRATKEDLDTIEAALEVMKEPEVQIVIQARFFEMPATVAEAYWAKWHNPGITNTHYSGLVLSPEQTKQLLVELPKTSGVKELSDGSLTTLSGRQAQIQTVEMKTIVVGINNGSVETRPMAFGPVLDVVPYVSPDGYSIQMTLIPFITEFLGYDDPKSNLPLPGSSASGWAPTAAQANPPLPHIRTKQIMISASALDGQTIVLGRPIQNEIRLRSDLSSTTQVPEDPKRNLMVLVTPTLVDRRGFRIHSDEEMSRQSTVQLPSPSFHGAFPGGPGIKTPTVSEWSKVKIGSAGEIYVNKKQMSLAEFTIECARLKKVGGAIVLFVDTPNHVANPAQARVIQTIAGAGVGMKAALKESELD